VFFELEHTPDPRPLAVLESTQGSEASIVLGDKGYRVTLPSPGLHYAVDAALALGATALVLGHELNGQAISRAFEHQAPVFGRGETIAYRGREISLTMMKNLPSLQVSLFLRGKYRYPTLTKCVHPKVDQAQSFGQPMLGWYVKGSKC
jgi:hypothetical protein